MRCDADLRGCVSYSGCNGSRVATPEKGEWSALLMALRNFEALVVSEIVEIAWVGLPQDRWPHRRIYRGRADIRKSCGWEVGFVHTLKVKRSKELRSMTVSGLGAG